MCRAGLGVKVVKGGLGMVAVVLVPLVGLLGIVVVAVVEAASGAVSLFRRGLMVVASVIATLSMYIWALKMRYSYTLSERKPSAGGQGNCTNRSDVPVKERRSGNRVYATLYTYRGYLTPPTSLPVIHEFKNPRYHRHIKHDCRSTRGKQ